MEVEHIFLSTAIFELVVVHELIKEVYYIALKSSEVHTKYRTISKTFGIIPQSIFHEDNSTSLKFATVSKIYPRTKHISIPCHFFQKYLEHIQIKVAAVSTDNQLAYQFTKGLL